MLINTRIEELDLTVRSYNCLKREGLHTIGDVLTLSDMELLGIHNIGMRSVDEVKERFATLGYIIREDPRAKQ